MLQLIFLAIEIKGSTPLAIVTSSYKYIQRHDVLLLSNFINLICLTSGDGHSGWKVRAKKAVLRLRCLFGHANRKLHDQGVKTTLLRVRERHKPIRSWETSYNNSKASHEILKMHDQNMRRESHAATTRNRIYAIDHACKIRKKAPRRLGLGG